MILNHRKKGNKNIADFREILKWKKGKEKKEKEMKEMRTNEEGLMEIGEKDFLIFILTHLHLPQIFWSKRGQTCRDFDE